MKTLISVSYTHLYYKIGLTTDFTGKLFNEMYSWLGFSQDKLNDVVPVSYTHLDKPLSKIGAGFMILPV